MKNKYSWDMLRAALLIIAAAFAVPAFAAGGSSKRHGNIAREGSRG